MLIGVLQEASDLQCRLLWDEAMLHLSEKWAPLLGGQPETGMGYQICTVVLSDGRHIERVVVVGGIVTEASGSKEIPFTADEIVEMRVTHGQ